MIFIFLNIHSEICIYQIILQLIIYLTFCWMKEEFQENLMIMEDLKAYLEIYHFQKIQTLK